MSSIYGKVNFNRTVTEQELVLIEEKLNHWNADDKGKWSNNTTGLGHLMLYNTPESLNEKLPLFDGESKLAITADARIDNRDELAVLLNIDAEIKGMPDSTLILLLYKKYGKACAEHLIGDFAFAIWDETLQQLFCARDHMGVKPFFYYQDENCFAFASEKKGLLCLPGIDKQINMQFLYNQMFRMSDQDVDATLYEHIKRLPPAHTLTLNTADKSFALEQYWDMDAVTELKLESEEAYYDAFRKHFEEAVKCRLRTAYPIAVELSGGMDSSGITGVASRFLKQEGKNLITISNTVPRHVTDPEKLEKSERKWIDAVVDFNKIERSIITTDEPPKHCLEGIDKMLEINDGLENWHQHWQMPIRKAALQEGIRTLLSGFPGDEMVTYRGKYYYLDHLDKKQYLKYLFSKRKFPGFHKLSPLVPHSIRYKLHLFKNALGLYNKHIKDALKIFNIPAKNITKKGDVNWLHPLTIEQFKSYRHYQKQRFLRPHLPARMESETRYGYYFRLEPRFPMADIRLTQFYLSMPNYLKYQGELHRTAYRKALKDYLPKEVLERDNKTGGMAPYIEPRSEAEGKAFQEENNKLITQMLNTLNGNSLFKHPIKKERVDFPVFRWLEKNWNNNKTS